jgi:hypothetical protein
VEDIGFQLWYTGTMINKNRVGIVLDKSLKDGVVNIKRQGDMIILVKLLVGDLIFNVISTYAPQIGLNESIKRQFWEQLDALVSSVPISEKLFIREDLNGHVGSTRVDFDGVHEGFGYGSRNQEGEGILNFALAYDLFVANTVFRNRVSHLVTFSSGQHCSQIDFILVRREDRHTCLDCSATPGGRRYFLLLVDDLSRYMWVVLLGSKGEAADAIRRAQATAEVECGRKLRVLRNDNGGEFTATEFASYCAGEGVQRHYSAPYSP